MTQEPFDKMLLKARERLESAKILLNKKQYSDSIFRSYYAVLDTARTLLSMHEIYPKSHAGTITKFNLHFIKTGIFPKNFSKLLAQVEKSRTEADYSFEINFTKDEAEDRLRLAETFVKEVTKHINFINKQKQ